MRNIVSPLSGIRSPFGGRSDLYKTAGFRPEFVADFGGEYYRANLARSTFADTLTFSRASSATMVDSTGTLVTVGVDEPRIGHHIWDGSAWVNAGYLHESEARTNFLLSADDLSNASYWSPLSGASTPVATSPIMGANAWTLSGAGYLRQSGLSIAASTTHTVWFRMRLPSSPAAGKLRIRIYDSNSGAFITLANGSTVSDFVYDTSGAVTRDTSAVDFLTDEGNGVYLVGAAFTTLATVTTHFVFIYPDVSNSTQPVDVATPQLEAGSTPSSYIPTNGAAATRAAETLTAPSAKLPWPTPQVIGDELVTNGTFDTDTTGWTGNNATLSTVSNRLRVTDAGVGAAAWQAITTEVGKVYSLTLDYLLPSSNANSDYQVHVRENTFGGTPLASKTSGFVEDVEASLALTFVATTTVSVVVVQPSSATNDTADFDNISVREIDPLAVSIQMEGRQTGDT
jgi:hypothetical protein